MTGCSYLTVCPQASFLQPGPDALDAASVLRVAGAVTTDALVLLHQRVVHQTWEGHMRTMKELLLLLVPGTLVHSEERDGRHKGLGFILEQLPKCPALKI